MASEVLTFAARVRLDWSAPAHWAPQAARCRRCHTATHGRDERGHPIHLSCQEEELAAELAAQLSNQLVDERYLPLPREQGGVR